MRISVSLDDRKTGKNIIWAEKTADDSFICPKCQTGRISIVYKDGMPKKGLRCSNCKAKYSINLTM